MNALEIVQQVTDELGLNKPTVLVGTADLQIRQILALLNRLGSDLCTQFEWEQLNREHILTTFATQSTGDTVLGSAVITNIPSTAGLSTRFAIGGPGIAPFAQIVSVDSATQVTMNMPAQADGTGVALDFSQVQYPLPSDWQRQIPQTEWDRTNRWPLMGPQTPEDWQSFKSGIVYAGPRQRFRILGGLMTINPLPPNGLTFAFEYISNAWVRGAMDAPQTKILADTDTFVFNDSLLITGLKTQWKASKGLNASHDIGEFRGLLESAKSQNKSAKTLSLSPVSGSIMLSTANIQDGNFPA